MEIDTIAEIIAFAVKYVNEGRYHRSDQAIVQGLRKVSNSPILGKTAKGQSIIQQAKCAWKEFSQVNPNAIFQTRG